MYDTDRGTDNMWGHPPDLSSHPSSILVIDGRHEELVASLDSLGSKLAAIRLVDHIRAMPDLRSSPYSLVYHIDSLRRLCDIIKRPIPISGHLGFLWDLHDLLDDTSSTVAERAEHLGSAKARIEAILAAELAVRGRWKNAVACLHRSGIDPDAFDMMTIPIDMRLPRLLEMLGKIFPDEPIQWPLHFSPPACSPPGLSVIHTVLVDSPEIPAHYREGYLALIEAAVTLNKSRASRAIAIFSRDGLGDGPLLSDELRALIREAADHSMTLLGSSAEERVQSCHMDIHISLRGPSMITEIRGRSIMLPLILVLSEQLAKELNHSFEINLNPSVVWTGDVDEEGNLRSVAGIESKAIRVIASRYSGMVYPAGNRDEARRALAICEPSTGFTLTPIRRLVDTATDLREVRIRNRNLLIRLGSKTKRMASRHNAHVFLAAGASVLVVALLSALIARPMLHHREDIIQFSPELIMEAVMPAGRDSIRLLNSNGTTIEAFQIERTRNRYPALVDLEEDGSPEMFYGTSCADPIPGTLFCVDRHGNELWRFRGGFQEKDPRPYPLANSFNSTAAFVRDLDHDGTNEIICFFVHTPYYPSQIALLSINGEYQSSFWNPGHCGSSLFGNGTQSVEFADIDRDGFEEILIPGTNNGYNCAVLMVLDPRSIKGKGPDCQDDTVIPTWQSYVIFPKPMRLMSALGSPRMHSLGVSVHQLLGQHFLRVDLWAGLPGRRRVDAFSYLFDVRLNVVSLLDDRTRELQLELMGVESGEEFISWALDAFKDGEVETDVGSACFLTEMRRVRVIHGPPELLRP